MSRPGSRPLGVPRGGRQTASRTNLLDLGLLLLVPEDAAIELLALLAQVLNACGREGAAGATVSRTALYTLSDA
jgi:hypothetical protein